MSIHAEIVCRSDYPFSKRKEAKEKCNSYFLLKAMNENIGWKALVQQASKATELLSFAKNLTLARHNAMLRVSWDHCDNPDEQFILDCISYKLERASAKTCEHCGAYGLRRTAIPEPTSLCFSCYGLEYNRLFESASLPSDISTIL